MGSGYDRRRFDRKSGAKECPLESSTEIASVGQGGRRINSMKDSKPLMREKDCSCGPAFSDQKCKFHNAQIGEKISRGAAGSEREAFQKKVSELTAVLDKLRPGTGPAIAMFLEDAYEQGWQAARAAAPPKVHKYVGFPGKAMCGADGEITSIANSDVTCEECRAAAPAPPESSWVVERFDNGRGAGYCAIRRVPRAGDRTEGEQRR